MNLMKWLFGPPTKDQFAASMIAAFHQSDNLLQYIYDKGEYRLKTLEGSETYNEINLGNLYLEHCQLLKHQRNAHIAQLVQTFSIPKQELPDLFDVARVNLRPKIVLRAAYAELILRLGLKSESPFEGCFNLLGNHLVTTLAFTFPTSQRLISKADLEKWGVSYSDAMELAIENLTNSPSTFSKIDDGFLAGATADSFDAARLLLKNQVSSLEVKGDHVAMVPQRDALFVTGSDDDLGLKNMIDLADIARQDELRLLSPIPLRLVNGEWQDWAFPQTHESYPKYLKLEILFLAGIYADQKALLETIHNKKGTNDFVAEFLATQNNDTGRISSKCLWSSNGVSLLPKTDFIVFPRKKSFVEFQWNDVVKVVGHLMEPIEELYPFRYRVKTFPTDEQLSIIEKSDL